MRLGLCHDMDGDVFFDAGRVDEALAICARCPVRETCLEYAIENKVEDGVWGGVDMAPLQRQRKSGERRRRRQPRTKMEPVCPFCGDHMGIYDVGDDRHCLVCGVTWKRS